MVDRKDWSDYRCYSWEQHTKHRRRPKSPSLKYRLEKRIIHGQEVEVKVYPYIDNFDSVEYDFRPVLQATKVTIVG